MIPRLVPSLCAFISLALLPVRAWDAVGHMLVADVAHGRLQPEVRAKLDDLARKMQYPGFEYDSVTMAAWMDDIRGMNGEPYAGQFKPWHYIDIGISPGDPMPSFTVTDPTNEASGNIVQALTRAVAVMKGGTDPLITDRWVAAAMIMHLVGDIHQPLHCSTYYFPTPAPDGKPDTDAGGNHVTVTDSAEEPGKMGPRKLNLHAFWDEAYRATYQDGGVALAQVPYGQSHQDSDIDPYRFDVTAYAPGPEVSLQTDFEAWARESNQLAKDYIYSALTFDGTHRDTNISADQVKQANDLARKRIVLAGYRLAKLMNDLLSDQPANSGIATAAATPAAATAPAASTHAPADPVSDGPHSPSPAVPVAPVPPAADGAHTQ